MKIHETKVFGTKTGDIAAAAGIPDECLEPYGTGAAKITLDAIDKMADRPTEKEMMGLSRANFKSSR